MSTNTASLTPEQSNAVNELIDKALNDFAGTVGTITGDAIKANQEKIIETAGTKITEAVNNNQKVIIAAEPSDSGKKDKEGKGWKTFMAVLPVILTAALGIWIWQVQKNIETKISENNERLKTELALKEEFYKKKLATYEKTHEQMSQFIGALENAQVNPNGISSANDSIRNLYKDYSSHSLYMSNAVVNELEELCDLGSDLPVLRLEGKGTATMDQVIEQLSKVETKMREDLHVDEIGQISEIIKRNLVE
jgi:hypothetical protein